MKITTSFSNIIMTALKTVVAYTVFIIFFFGTPVVRSMWDEYGGLRALTTNYKNMIIAVKPLKVEVVDTPQKRVKGLSGRESLGENFAMLFIFDKPDYHQIWMKDMNFSIDILWLDAGFFVIDYEKNVSPETYPESFIPNQVAKYVLEVPAGFIDKNFIKIGDQLSYF